MYRRRRRRWKKLAGRDQDGINVKFSAFNDNGDTYLHVKRIEVHTEKKTKANRRTETMENI